MAPRVEKLWRYTTLARTWSWSLIGVAGALLVVGIGLQAGSEDGLSARWLGIALGVSALTGVVFFPLLRVWLRRSGLPSVRLPSAKRESGTPRRLEAAPADWRRWTALTAGLLLVGGAAMLTFLIGVLGRGGTAEGVVVGVLTAWGLATLEDSRRIERTEAEEGRRYYAAGARPTGAGGKLVWVTAKEAQRA